ncbi:hypothetical protein ACKKBG_A17640 [Auxenochlorella protothecoides x Auxenochlorella symbiontica]
MDASRRPPESSSGQSFPDVFNQTRTLGASPNQDARKAFPAFAPSSLPHSSLATNTTFRPQSGKAPSHKGLEDGRQPGPRAEGPRTAPMPAPHSDAAPCLALTERALGAERAQELRSTMASHQLLFSQQLHALHAVVQTQRLLVMHARQAGAEAPVNKHDAQARGSGTSPAAERCGVGSGESRRDLGGADPRDPGARSGSGTGDATDTREEEEEEGGTDRSGSAPGNGAGGRSGGGSTSPAREAEPATHPPASPPRGASAPAEAITPGAAALSPGAEPEGASRAEARQGRPPVARAELAAPSPAAGIDRPRHHHPHKLAPGKHHRQSGHGEEDAQHRPVSGVSTTPAYLPQQRQRQTVLAAGLDGGWAPGQGPCAPGPPPPPQAMYGPGPPRFLAMDPLQWWYQSYYAASGGGRFMPPMPMPPLRMQQQQQQQHQQAASQVPLVPPPRPGGLAPKWWLDARATFGPPADPAVLAQLAIGPGEEGSGAARRARTGTATGGEVQSAPSRPGGQTSRRREGPHGARQRARGGGGGSARRPSTEGAGSSTNGGSTAEAAQEAGAALHEATGERREEAAGESLRRGTSERDTQAANLLLNFSGGSRPA